MSAIHLRTSALYLLEQSWSKLVCLVGLSRKTRFLASRELLQIARSLGVHSAAVAKAMRINHMAVYVDDIIFFADHAGIVRSCIEADGKLLIAVELLTRVSSAGSHSIWRLVPGLRVLQVSDWAITSPYCWAWREDGGVLLLHAHMYG